MPLPPPPPPVPPAAPPLGLFGSSPRQTSNSQTPSSPDRSNLLNEIRKAGGIGGRVQLKKAVTNDRSAPIVGSTAKSSPTPVSNGPSKSAGTANGTLKPSSSSCSSFQEQLNAAVKSGNKFGSSTAVNFAASQQKTAGGAVLKPDTPRPLPPTPGGVKSPTNQNFLNLRSTTSPSSVLPSNQSATSPKDHAPSSNQIAASPKGHAPLPPSQSQNQRELSPTNQRSTSDDRRLRSLTASNAEIAESTKQLAARFASRGVASPSTNQNPTTPFSNNATTNQNTTLVNRQSAVALTPTFRPAPPCKPPHLAGGRTAPPVPPPPPPTRPPSQRPPLDEVTKSGRRPDFRTLRPQKTLAAQVTVGHSVVASTVHRSSSDENLRKDQPSVPRPSGTNRPAPPPPPQRPPPLPPSITGRPTGAPPPPPPPQLAKLAAAKPAGVFSDSSAVVRRTAASALNGASNQPALPEMTPPPPPPPRSDSLTSDFERRFRFRTLTLLPAPDKFLDAFKQYPTPRNVRKSAPKMPSR